MSNWPQLSFETGKETYATIHLWSQIIGKIKLAKLPWINHSWHCTLHVAPFGLTSGVIPGEHKSFQIDLDFLKHELRISTSDQELITHDLRDLSVASCYHKLMDALHEFGVGCTINTLPNELEDPLPFPENHAQKTYDGQVAKAMVEALTRIEQVFTKFRAEFIGKCSPVHFFWGSFDLAVSRFSGNTAPLHPGGIPNLPDWVAQEAYSHEVCSAGFWFGNEAAPKASFYSYIYPAPENYEKAKVDPSAAYFSEELGEYLLSYEDVQKAENPNELLLQFLRSTYTHAAELADWNRDALERQWKFRKLKKD